MVSEELRKKLAITAVVAPSLRYAHWEGIYVQQLLIQVLELDLVTLRIVHYQLFVPSIFTVSQRKRKRTLFSFPSYGDEEAEICFSLFLPSRRCLASAVLPVLWFLKASNESFNSF